MTKFPIKMAGNARLARLSGGYPGKNATRVAAPPPGAVSWGGALALAHAQEFRRRSVHALEAGIGYSD